MVVSVLYVCAVCLYDCWDWLQPPELLRPEKDEALEDEWINKIWGIGKSFQIKCVALRLPPPSYLNVCQIDLSDIFSNTSHSMRPDWGRENAQFTVGFCLTEYIQVFVVFEQNRCQIAISHSHVHLYISGIKYWSFDLFLWNNPHYTYILQFIFPPSYSCYIYFRKWLAAVSCCCAVPATFLRLQHLFPGVQQQEQLSLWSSLGSSVLREGRLRWKHRQRANEASR